MSRRYRVVADFQALTGIDNLSFRRGAIVRMDAQGPKLLQQLLDRGAMLEALPD
jgi:hypothetical protein